MYIWIACDVSKAFDSLRAACIRINREFNLDEVAFSLPQHISLKMSFEVDDGIAADVIEFISEYLSEQGNFIINRPKIEIFGSILWLAFDDDSNLSRIHTELDDLLMERFCVPLHEFDRCFKFHSTLFIDEHEGLLRMQEQISRLSVPDEISIDSFLIGTSPSGKAGDYSVIKRIPCKK